MATIEKLIPLIMKWEGGYVNDPLDLGGATNRGVTLDVWQKTGVDKNEDGRIDEDDLKRIDRQDVVDLVLRPYYWDRCKADKIQSQSIANILVDWVWMSGARGIKEVQELLGIRIDGVVGEQTLRAINETKDTEALFNRIKQRRKEYIELICQARPANKKFRNGWLNRLDDFKYEEEKR